MTRLAQLAGALALVAATAALAACGSHTNTVTLGSTPAPPPSSASTSTPSPAPSTGASTGTQGAPGGGTSATTRTAPEPAFTGSPPPAEGVSGASAIVRARGYTPNNSSEYHPSQTLRVLVGTRSGSTDGHGQQAFFFVNGRYIGTDAREPSASMKVVSQGDTEVTLAYALYRSADALCCPGAGHARVRFALDNGKLVALDAIPTASSGANASRR